MKWSVKSLFKRGCLIIVAVTVVSYYFLTRKWRRTYTEFTLDLASSEEIKESLSTWSWTTFDAEKSSRENIDSKYYTEAELTPWIERPTYSGEYPGKNGDPYVMKNVTSEEQQRIDEGYMKYEFNELVCSAIPLHRSIRDDREESCKTRRWKKPLGTASVIIIFYNEAWCTLMRTIFSVLETSPKILLKEIILIDDVSTYDDLKSPLDEIVKTLKIVRLIRFQERSGIAPARMAGARASTGDVIVFLDAHCECAKGWLEPLMERIADEPKALISPVIEDMPYDTFSVKIRKTRQVPIGVTNWDLGFGWGFQRKRPADEPTDAVIKSPVVVGVSAIKKSYFFELGGFDEELKIWGAEQLEISFKVWLCGGTLEIHPCSHVGHMHRRGFQYNDLDNIITRNHKRVVEVWMGDYKEQFYRRAPKARFVDAGDLSKQIALRDKLKCKDFSWFLENLHPDMYAVPEDDVVYWGQWATGKDPSAVCFDSGSDVFKPMLLFPCHGETGNQLLMYTRQGEMRLNAERERCLVPRGSKVSFTSCVYPKAEVPEKQRWKFIENLFREVTLFPIYEVERLAGPEGHIQHSTGQCLQNVDNKEVWLKPCANTRSQIWHYRNMPEEPGYDVQKSIVTPILGFF